MHEHTNAVTPNMDVPTRSVNLINGTNESKNDSDVDDEYDEDDEDEDDFDSGDGKREKKNKNRAATGRGTMMKKKKALKGMYSTKIANKITDDSSVSVNIVLNVLVSLPLSLRFISSITPFRCTKAAIQ